MDKGWGVLKMLGIFVPFIFQSKKRRLDPFTTNTHGHIVGVLEWVEEFRIFSEERTEPTKLR